MFRAAVIFLIAFIFSAMPVGVPADPVSSENLKPGPKGQEAPFVLELVAELAAR